MLAGLMTPILSATPRAIYEGQEVKVSCLAPDEEGTLIFHLYVNDNYNRPVTSAPPGTEVAVKLTTPGSARIHCKTTLLANMAAGESNISNVVNVIVRGESQHQYTDLTTHPGTNHIDDYNHMGAAVVQEVKKSFSNQKVASSIPHCRSVLEQDTEPLIAPDVQCAISVNVKCVYIVSRTYVSRFG